MEKSNVTPLVPKDKNIDESKLREKALDDDSIKSFIGDKEIKKIIIVPNRIINIVV